MNTELSLEATEFGRETQRALGAAGGDQLVQDVEEGTTPREGVVSKVLSELGVWDLDARGNGDELEAAAAAARSCGWWAVPYPVAERLARPSDGRADGLVVVDSVRPAGAVGDLGELQWLAVTPEGRRSRVIPRQQPAELGRTSFVAPLDLEPLLGDSVGDVALGLVLPCWTLLGMLDRAFELSRDHVTSRQQFGRPLSALQAVQFQLTDAEVERRGVEMLAKYALWSVKTGRAEALDDALALRLAAVEAADLVFRVAHQLHGATGFCDETTLSWISRYSLPLRRLPLGPLATRQVLTRRLGRKGLTGLYRGDGG